MGIQSRGTDPLDAPQPPDPAGARVVVGAGPRALEARLFAEIERWVAAAGADPAVLARPVRVLVPSRSLVQHVAARLVRRAGRPVLGVAVRTAHAIACEILARAGEAVPAGEAVLDLLVRRAAREEPALAPLAGLVDGHVGVAASVRDLLDAGLEPAHAEALDEALADESGAPELALRARAVVRIARGIAREIEAGRLGHRAQLFRRAREIVERDPEAALPSRAILIHGFADATGAVTDLLEALVRCAGARLFLDRPPDPADPSAPDPGARFSERFATRVLGAAVPAPEAAPLGRIEVLHAPGAWAEARAVAEQLRAALDAGAIPEELAVVARDLGTHRLALRAQLGRLAIPFSGLGELGPPDAAGRRLADLRALLREGVRLRSERWVELQERLVGHARLGPCERSDLRVALHALGAARLAQVAELPTRVEGAQGDVPLPVRAGLAADEDGVAYAPRRRLERSIVDATIRAARRLVADLAAFAAPPALRPLAERAQAIRAIATQLGWERGDPGLSELEAALADAALGPPDLDVDAEELRLLLERRLADAGRAALGGAGGGVQILNVTEARARSFEGLWLVGLRRDAFPRAVSEDPLLPDALRARLRALLPDLPLKRDGHDEERFLFAQLVAASPQVRLLASSCDDDGRACEPSPLVERLRRAPHVVGPTPVASSAGRAALAAAGPRPAHERALLAGLHGSAEEFAALLPLALDEVWREEAEDGAAMPEAGAARALAAGRVAVLRELDRAPHSASRLGPYFGFVGALGAESDPRRGPVAVTTLERLFRCPWQTFLSRCLHLEAPPDAGAELPSADPLRLGSLVHRVLDRLAQASLAAPGQGLAEAARRAPVAIAWPAEPELLTIARETAREMLREQGIALAGFERVLALAALAPLGVARALDAAGPPALVGSEVEGVLEVSDASGAPRALRFRADRVERLAETLRLTDLKTGRPKVSAVRPENRYQGLLKRVRSGELLQGPVYARAARALGAEPAIGRYLHLHPDALEATRELAADGGDLELAGVLDTALRTALAAWDAGSFFPQLVEPEQNDKEGSACRGCGVREACLRGDSSARGRLVAATSRPAGPGSRAAAALLALWRRGDET